MPVSGGGSGTPIVSNPSSGVSATYIAPPKTPTSVLKYSFDWSDWLNGAQIQSSTWAAPSGILVSGIAPVGPIASASVSGGTARTAYRVTNTVVSDAGETDTRSLLIVVEPVTAGASGIQSDMLVYRLYKLIAPRDGVPGDYEQLVIDAVNRLSQDVPLLKRATLNVVAGQAAYTLPDGFQAMIELSSPMAEGGVIISNAGIIPVSAGWEEEYDIAGNQLTFTPTPTYTMSRAYRYSAAHVLTEGRYTTLTENLARIALLYAQSQALTLQAAAVAGNSWKYTIGDESVDKTGQSKGLQAQAEALLSQYKSEVRKLQGYGSQATFDSAGY